MVICTNVFHFFRCFLSVFCATVVRMADENQVWEKIIHGKDCKAKRLLIQVVFVNINRCVIL